jgi:hypothetical protein
MNNEIYLSVAAAAFELGVPVAAIFVLLRSPRYRQFAAVALGAVTPLSVFFCIMFVSYAINPSSEDNNFSFHAMWVIFFIVYIAILLVGLALSFIPRPANSYVRFFIGCALAPVAYALLSLTT